MSFVESGYETRVACSQYTSKGQVSKNKPYLRVARKKRLRIVSIRWCLLRSSDDEKTAIHIVYNDEYSSVLHHYSQALD